jgi:hypothetical protein
MPRHFIHRVYIFLVTSSLTKIFFLLLASIHLQEHIILLRFYSCHLGQVQIYMCIIIQLTPMILPVSFCRLICCSHRRSQLQDPLHWVARLLKLILVQHLSLPLWRTLALKFMLIRCLVCPRLGFLLKIWSACSSTRHVLHPLSLCRVSIEDSSSVQQHSPRAASSESVPDSHAGIASASQLPMPTGPTTSSSGQRVWKMLRVLAYNPV